MRRADEPAATPGATQIALRFARLTGGFWRGATAARAWFWSLTLAGAIVFSVFVNVTVNRWSGWFFDTLETRDRDGALVAMAVFPVLVLAAAGIGVAILVARETFQVRWREWVAARLADGWIGERRFFRLGLSGYEPANPEYRIADDVRWATEPVVDFAIGLLSSIITVITFIGILWSIGGDFTVGEGAMAVTIPAYMVLAAIAYAVGVSGLVALVGRRLPGLIAARNEGEARLRFALMRIRDHGETIALGRSEVGERRAVAATYDGLVTRWLAMIRQRGRLTWITNGSGALVPVVPLLLAAPKYLGDDMSLGGVVQVAAAFVAVQNAFNWLLDNFMRIAEWLAAARRVDELADALARIARETPAGDLAARLDPEGRLRFDGVTLTDRDGRTLAADLDFSLAPGEVLHLAGELGLGRAALIQAVAGLWPWGRGVVALPEGAHVTVVPQRLHLSRGTLREALDPRGRSDGALLSATLQAYGLSALVPDLDADRDWDALLGLGDRQRLAFARAELEAPDIVVLDEATSGLEAEAALDLIGRLRAARPAAILLLVGNDAGFAEAATRRLALKRAGGVVRIVGAEPARAAVESVSAPAPSPAP